MGQAQLRSSRRTGYPRHNGSLLNTIRQALTEATARLSASPELRDTAPPDALVLLLHVLGISRANVYAAPDRELTAEQQEAYDNAIARRLTHEPIQYITGQQEFYGLNLRVTPAVLIPRPETEHLVESVLNEFQPSTIPTRMLDVGTGSGAIAIALAAHMPNAEITAVDISPAALELAASNAAAHQLSTRIRFVRSDLAEGVEEQGPFDAVVSNPPYIDPTDQDTLHPQVRNFEPHAALFAEEEGLAIYRRLIPQARCVLRPGGLLALEIGQGQCDALTDLLSGWQAVRFVNDLQQIPRVALARKP